MPKKKGYYLVPGMLDFDPKLLQEQKHEAVKLREEPEKYPDHPEPTAKRRALWEAEG